MNRLTMRLHDGKIGCLSEYTIKDLAKKLADYEDAEENGMLIHLPCRVGDTVYGLYWDDDYCASVKEYKFTLTFYEHCKDSFGETLFLTKEEAEQALAKMGE